MGKAFDFGACESSPSWISLCLAAFASSSPGQNVTGIFNAVAAATSTLSKAMPYLATTLRRGRGFSNTVRRYGVIPTKKSVEITNEFQHRGFSQRAPLADNLKPFFSEQFVVRARCVLKGCARKQNSHQTTKYNWNGILKRNLTRAINAKRYRVTDTVRMRLNESYFVSCLSDTLLN